MTLKDCTKEELIFIIERLKLHFIGNGDYYLSMALIDVQDAREHKKFEQSKQLTALSQRMRQKYIDLMRPYEGKPLIDIPASVLRMAGEYLKAAEKADRKWMKLNGIKPDAQKGGVKHE